LALETGTYISDLNAANPPSGDNAGQGADHLRLIKMVLKNTFPNITGPVTATQVQLGAGVPTGGIIMWTGVSAPTGWSLCDGGSYSKVDGSGPIVAPNLQDRFIVGSGNSYALGATGGATSNTPTIGVNGTALTASNLPAHSHTITDPGHTHSITDPGHSHTYTPALASVASSPGGNTTGKAGTPVATSTDTTGITGTNSGTTGITTTDSFGSGTAHTHLANSSAVPTVPPYYALAFIMKL